MKNENWKAEAEASALVIQVVKRGKRIRKVLTHIENRNFMVSRLTYRSASKTQWADISLLGSDLEFVASRAALVALHARLTEVLNEK